MIRNLIVFIFVLFVGLVSAVSFRELLEEWRQHELELTPEGVVNRLREQFPYKQAFVDLCGALARAEGFRICNQRLRGGRGLVGYLHDQGGIERWGEAERCTERVSDGLKEMGIPFLYVMAPTKIDLAGELFPAGWSGCNLNRDAATFLANLSAKGVPVLNLIPNLVANADDVSKNFFRTDHHWTYRAAMKAAGLVLDRLALTLGDPELSHHPNVSPTNWSWHVRKECFLGSVGRRTGRFFAGVDDFEYAYPRFSCAMERRIPATGFRTSGDFRQAETCGGLIADDDLRVNRYAFYTGGNVGVQIHRCLNAPFPHRVLIVKDSFGDPVTAFLATVFREVVQVDMRYLPEGEPLLKVVSRHRPDAVVAILNAYGLVTYKLESGFREKR